MLCDVIPSHEGEATQNGLGEICYHVTMEAELNVISVKCGNCCTHRV